MRTVANMLAAAEKVNIPVQVEQSLFDSSKEYVRIQKEQMFSGYRSDNKQINPLHGRYQGYSERTIEIKRAKGQVTNRVTLQDEGDFYEGVFIHVDNTAEAVVDSKDSKSEKLQEYYGEEIFGLNHKSKVVFKPIAEQHLIEGVIKELNKK